ncbi:MAG: hypothetical protein HQ518_11765 [Rhodopirellula sp.]|nr:hypothetical protein [Rhodopirellula sp.]
MIAPVNKQPEDRNDVRYVLMRNGRVIERDRPDIINELIELKRELLEQDDDIHLWQVIESLTEWEAYDIETEFLEAARCCLGRHAEAPVLERKLMLERLSSVIDWSLRLQRDAAVNEYLGKLGLSGHEELAEEFNNQMGSYGLMMLEKS